MLLMGIFSSAKTSWSSYSLLDSFGFFVCMMARPRALRESMLLKYFGFYWKSYIFSSFIVN